MGWSQEGGLTLVRWRNGDHLGRELLIKIPSVCLRRDLGLEGWAELQGRVVGRLQAGSAPPSTPTLTVPSELSPLLTPGSTSHPYPESSGKETPPRAGQALFTAAPAGNGVVQPCLAPQGCLHLPTPKGRSVFLFLTLIFFSGWGWYAGWAPPPGATHTPS